MIRLLYTCVFMAGLLLALMAGQVVAQDSPQRIPPVGSRGDEPDRQRDGQRDNGQREAADRRADDAAIEDVPRATLDRFRNNYWRYAQKSIRFEDDYVTMPVYDRRYPSSRGVTVLDALRELSREERRNIGGGLYRMERITPPRIEAEAYALILPRLAVGEYGYIHSVRVREILGPDEMLVEDLWLIDSQALTQAKRDMRDRLREQSRERVDTRAIDQQFEQRDRIAQQQRDRAFRNVVRIKGFPTRGLTVRERWYGPDDGGIQLAIVLEEQVQRSRTRTEERFVAIPVSWFERDELSEAQFIDLLAKRGYTIASFVEMMQEEMVRDSRTAHERIFLNLMPPKKVVELE